MIDSILLIYLLLNLLQFPPTFTLTDFCYLLLLFLLFLQSFGGITRRPELENFGTRIIYRTARKQVFLLSLLCQRCIILFLCITI